jgi:hypothetical protein
MMKNWILFSITALMLATSVPQIGAQSAPKRKGTVDGSNGGQVPSSIPSPAPMPAPQPIPQQAPTGNTAAIDQELAAIRQRKEVLRNELRQLQERERVLRQNRAAITGENISKHEGKYHGMPERVREMQRERGIGEFNGKHKGKKNKHEDD